MEKFKSHFVFNRQQRSGVLFLVLLISGMLCFYFLVDFSKDITFDISSEEIQILTKEIDSLRIIELESRKPKKYPFNPNFISDFKGYSLGMSTKEIDRLLKYRSEDKWINSIKEFQEITKVSDSLLEEIGPYFKFPDWVNNIKPNKKSLSRGLYMKNNEEKKDLNIVKELELQKINGIGETLSNRIIKYRKKLGSFSADSQLYNIYGLDYQLVQRILNDFTVKTPKVIEKMNINTYRLQI